MATSSTLSLRDAQARGLDAPLVIPGSFGQCFVVNVQSCARPKPPSPSVGSRLDVGQWQGAGKARAMAGRVNIGAVTGIL